MSNDFSDTDRQILGWLSIRIFLKKQLGRDKLPLLEWLSNTATSHTHIYIHTQTHTPIFTPRSLTYQSLTRICMAALCCFISSFSFKWTQLQLLTLTLLHLYKNLENFSKGVGPTPCFPLPNHAKDRYKQIFLQATDSLHLDKIYFNEIIFIIPLFYYSIQ